MAHVPNVDNPEYGYFYSAVQEEIVFYVSRLLEITNESVLFNCHASAIFFSDEEQKEIHMPSSNNIILDPDMPNLTDIIENKLDLCRDPDRIELVEGSGWSIDIRTIRYWFKVIPCRPNPTPNPTMNNSSDYETDGTDFLETTGEPGERNVQYINTFLFALAEFEWRHDLSNVGSKLSNTTFIKRNSLLRYIKNERPNLYADENWSREMNLQDIAEWHWKKRTYNIRVFSIRGNVLYAKRFSDTAEWTNLYINSSKKIAYIQKLNALFQRSLDRNLCDNCYTFHRDPEHCKLKILQNDKEDVTIPEFPIGRHALVMYSDFESIQVNPDATIENIELAPLDHVVSGWATCTINKNHEILEKTTKNALEVPQNMLIDHYLEHVYTVAFNYAFEGPVRVERSLNCKICGDLIQETDFIVGKNFINGEAGCHHKSCWGDRKNSLYVFFHNFRGYDSHFLMKKLVDRYEIDYMNAVSMEKFNLIVSYNNTSFGSLQVTFKDTYNFFTCSLAKCVSMIQDWRYTPEHAQNAKGIFPYDWFDTVEKLKATALPPPPWNNKLTRSELNHEDAFKEWEKHGFSTFGEYHDFYMLNDTTQLADAFEEFRRTCINEFDLDPVYFQGAPGYTWYLGVKSNKDLFKIIKDRRIYLDIQSQIRGGVSQAMQRYANVENKPNESIFFLDVNSLYSKCMTYKMPGKYLETITELPENWQDLYANEGPLTAFIVVDLFYPQHLHDRDFAYPLAPHKYNERLCTTFLPKEKYMVHAELLKFYLEKGLVLEKVHYAYVFEQDYTLRDYVQTNIDKRRNTESEVMKTLYKLLNNSLYGKTCENVFKYRKFGVVKYGQNNDGALNSEISYSTNYVPFDEAALCEFPVLDIKLNKPIQIGFTVLEFAKREIYKFLLAVIEEFGSTNCIPLYTDTDSIMFWCNFSKPWQVFYNNERIREYLDFEKVPKEWNVKTTNTDKVSGLWSPEANGKEIMEYCGLRSKTYAYRFKDNKEVIKNKGVPKSAMISNRQNEDIAKIRLEHYKNAVFKGEEYYVNQYQIKSSNHVVQTQKIYKLGISGNDLKRTVLSDRIHSLPFGYAGELFIDSVTDLDDPDQYSGWRLAETVV